MAVRQTARQQLGSARAPRIDAAVAAKLRTHSSTAIAKNLEYQMLGDLGAELLLRGAVMEVLRSDIDAFGHDVVLEVSGIIRHIQLKTKVQGGRNFEVSCHKELGRKPSGCIVWITYDPQTYRAIEYACYGGRPGEALPDVGDVIAKRSTRNKKGETPLRQQHKNVHYRQFTKITEIGELVDWLFGAAAVVRFESKPTVVMGPTGTPMLIKTAFATVLPIVCNLTDQTALVHVIDHNTSSIHHEEDDALMVLLDLRSRTWSCEPTLDNPAITELLAETIDLLRQSLEFKAES